MDYQKELVKIVGPKAVATDSAILNSFSKDHSLVREGKADYVVYPENTSQVQDIVNLANKTKQPLIPVSSGEPRFRGDTVPSMGGTVVDLSKMDKILMIDRLERVAMVEPGVRFDQFRSTAAKEGLRIMNPLGPRSSKSVLASALEREPHIIPKYHLDGSEPMLCTEVVYGTGDLFRTGDAAGPGTIEEQWKVGRRQKSPLGMKTDEFRYLQAAQGTLGILTWSTVRCELLPTAQKPFLAVSDSFEDLLELAYRLVRLRLGDEIFLLNRTSLANLAGESEEEIEILQQTLPAWNLYYCLAGYEHLPEERIAYQEKDIARILQSLNIKVARSAAGLSAHRVMEAASVPREKPWRLGTKAGVQEIPFITSYNNLSKLISVMNDTCTKYGYPVNDLGTYIQPVCQGHGYHCEFDLVYNPANPQEAARVKEVYLKAGENLMNNGGFFSRPYDLLANSVFNRDAVSCDALKKLKTIYDPNNILNPGKLCF